MKFAFIWGCVLWGLVACNRGDAPVLPGKNNADTSDAIDMASLDIAEIEKKIAENPDNPSLLYQRGLYHASEEDYTLAIQDFTAVLELDSLFAAAYHDRGICEFQLEQYDQALQDYTTTIRMIPDFAEAYYNRAMIFDIQNKIQRAIDDYSKAIEFDASMAPAYYNRGVHLFKTDKSKACEDFKRAMDLGDPDGAGAWNKHCKP